MQLQATDFNPYFKNSEKSEKFVKTVGALVLKIISLRKASEILDIEEKTLLELFDLIGFEYSLLEEKDVILERGN